VGRILFGGDRGRGRKWGGEGEEEGSARQQESAEKGGGVSPSRKGIGLKGGGAHKVVFQKKREKNLPDRGGERLQES